MSDVTDFKCDITQNARLMTRARLSLVNIRCVGVGMCERVYMSVGVGVGVGVGVSDMTHSYVQTDWCT